MPLYTPTIWVNNETPRSAALFNKREQGINALFNKRAYWNSKSVAYAFSSSGYVEFGTYNGGLFYDYAGVGRYDTGVVETGSGGNDKVIHMPSWASFGMAAVTIILENTDHTSSTQFQLNCGAKYTIFDANALAAKNHNTMHAKLIGDGDISLYCVHDNVNFDVKLSALFY